MKKEQISFKPFDSHEWNDVKSEDAKKVLTEDEYKTLKKDKHYKLPTGIFKIK
tara:strand:- start:6329 stop:6487 length:159 start_codon:yes stop_codon:yes gene_type:complete